MTDDEIIRAATRFVFPYGDCELIVVRLRTDRCWAYRSTDPRPTDGSGGYIIPKFVWDGEWYLRRDGTFGPAPKSVEEPEYLFRDVRHVLEVVGL